MSSGNKKLLHEWIRIAQSLGWTVRHTAKHVQFRNPDGEVVITSGTPGRGRSERNDRARLRRSGLPI